MRGHYYLFRYGESNYGYRLEDGNTVQEACKKAFGVIYASPHNGSIVYKDLGTKSPRYVSAKVKQMWYADEGWTVIPASN